MANTLNNKKGRDDKKYKVINLKYEYEGYEGSEKWAIISELSEEELFGLYPDEMRRYSPFVLLSVEQGKVISDFKANEDKHRLKQQLFAQAIASLTEKQRKHLLLWYVEGKTSAQIAREDGVSEQAVRKNAQAAIKKFEKFFGDFFRK